MCYVQTVVALAEVEQKHNFQIRILNKKLHNECTHFKPDLIKIFYL